MFELIIRNMRISTIGLVLDVWQATYDVLQAAMIQIIYRMGISKVCELAVYFPDEAYIPPKSLILKNHEGSTRYTKILT